MELRHLRYLVTVVDERNFTRAAQRLHVAQPGVSAQIRQLERELGEPLLDRTGRNIRPTTAGEAFLPYARAALAAAAAGAEGVAALSGLVRGRLRVGTVGTISSTALDLPALLAGFHAEHPGVDISLHEDATVALLAGIAQGRLDAALVGLGGAHDGEIVTVELVRERLVAVMPTHQTRPGRLRVADLADRPLILPREGTGLRDRLDAAFAGAGIRPRIVFESGDPSLLVRLTTVGLGVAVVPASVAARHHDPAVAPIALTPRIDGRIGLAWHRVRPPSPAARAFIAHVQARRVV